MSEQKCFDLFKKLIRVVFSLKYDGLKYEKSSPNLEVIEVHSYKIPSEEERVAATTILKDSGFPQATIRFVSEEMGFVFDPPA